MALFARRRVQEAIDQCGQFMPPDAIARKVAELNASNDKSLPTEWEVMITAATSKLCPVRYEPDLGGSRRGDLLMMPDEQGSAGCLVEITTISDDFAHAQNPVDDIFTAIHRKLRKLKCPDQGIHIQVGGDTVGAYDDARMVLQTGDRRPERLFDNRFYKFARALKAAPDTPASHQWTGPGLDIELTYTPGQRGGGSGHPSFTTPYSRRRNSLYKALKKKCEQLGGTGHPGPFGVVICDGGCDLLSSRLDGSGGTTSLRDIMSAHFKDSSRLSFVVILHAELPLPSCFNRYERERLLHATPFLRTNACEIACSSLGKLRALPDVLPRPYLDGLNAARCYRYKWEDKGWQGADGSITMSDNKIRLSARAVLDLLAGAKTTEEFFAAFSNQGFFTGNHFMTQKRKGRLITKIELLKGEDDDDHVEFTFGSPDPAVNPYRTPIVGDGEPTR